MSEKNTHEWYSYAHGVAFRVQRFADFSGSPCVRLKGGTYVPYSIQEIERNISAGKWLPVSRPVYAIAPAYGLEESDEPVSKVDRVEPPTELTTLRQQHADALEIIEALLKKYEPETLAKLRGGESAVTKKTCGTIAEDFVEIPWAWRRFHFDEMHSPACNSAEMNEDECVSLDGDMIRCLVDCPVALAWESAGCPR